MKYMFIYYIYTYLYIYIYIIQIENYSLYSLHFIQSIKYNIV